MNRTSKVAVNAFRDIRGDNDNDELRPQSEVDDGEEHVAERATCLGSFPADLSHPLCQPRQQQASQTRRHQMSIALGPSEVRGRPQRACLLWWLGGYASAARLVTGRSLSLSASSGNTQMK